MKTTNLKTFGHGLAYTGLIVASLFLTWAKAEPTQVALKKTKQIVIKVNFDQQAFDSQFDGTESVLEKIEKHLAKERSHSKAIKVQYANGAKGLQQSKHSNTEFKIQLIKTL